MTATTVGNLVANLEMRSAQFVSEIRRVNRRLSGFQAGLKRTASVGRTAFRSIAVAAGAVTLTRLTADTIETTDRMGKLAQRLKITTEGISELGFVAERGGVSFNTLALGIQRLERRVAEAARGTGEAKSALRELNIDATKLVQLNLDQQFEVVAEALSQVANESDRTRLAMKLFDSEGVQLVQTMQDGAKGIRELRIEAQKLGVTISSDVAARAAAANDNMTRFRAAVGALARSIAIQIIPPLTEFFRWLAEHLPSGIQISIRWWNEIKRVFLDVVASFLSGFASIASGAAIFLNELAPSMARSLDTVAVKVGLLAEEFRMMADEAANASNQASERLKELAQENRGRQTGPPLPPGVDLEDFKIDSISIPTEELKGDIASAIRAAGQEGGAGLARSLLESLQSRFIDRFAEMLANAIGDIKLPTGGGGGGLGGFFKSLIGFRTGGQFSVGGSGGNDSKVVAFRATPGEDVFVRRPGQSASSAAPVVQLYQAPGVRSEVTQDQSGAVRIVQQVVEDTFSQWINEGTGVSRLLESRYGLVRR